MRRRSRFARFAACGALAHARFAALRRSRSRPVRRFGRRRSRSRSVRRFAVAALSLRSARRFAASPLRGGAPAHARLAALRLRRSRSRPAFRFGWRSRSARFAALRRSRSRPGGFYLINIYLNIIINQSRRRREAPAFRTAKKYAPSGGVFPLSDIYFCFAYSAIALYFSKSSGRRMRALAGLVEGSSMHGMQPQGSQNRL